MKKVAKMALVLLGGLSLISVAEARTWDQIKKAGTIKIGTEGAFKPFNYFEGKKITGFEIEVGEALAKKLGVKVQWIAQPFDSLLIGVNQDRYDFVIASHGISAERQKVVDFSNPHYCTGGLIVSKDAAIKTAKDLNGKKVAVQVGTSYLANAEKVEGIQLKTFPKDTDAQQALLSGTVDAWISDKFGALDMMKANTNAGLVSGDLLFQEKVAMVVKKGNKSVVAQLNNGLSSILKDGSYAKISQKYFAQDVRCK